MKDIVIINHDPLITRIKNGFCIDNLIDMGFNVTYLDLSKFYFDNIETPFETEESYVKKFTEENEILNYLNSLDINNTIFISEAYPSWKSRHIYKFLSNNNATVGRIAIYGNSTLVNPNLFQKFKILKFKDLFPLFCFKLYIKFYKIKIWDQVLTSNHNHKDMGVINHPDYEEFMNVKKSIAKESKYIVFLDECFPCHPEIVFWNRKNLEKFRKPYLDSINRLFDYLEATFDKEVIICAHPKSNYIGNEFGKRKIIKGKSAQMVRKSEFVLMHSSTSASFAILNDVPIIVLTSPEYKHNLKETLHYQKIFANLLGLKILDMNKWRPKKGDISGLDPWKREYYIYSYLTSRGQENKHNFSIIYDFLNNLQ